MSEQQVRLKTALGVVLALGSALRVSRRDRGVALRDALKTLARKLEPALSELGEVAVRLDGKAVSVNGAEVAEAGPEAPVELIELRTQCERRGVGGFRFLRMPAVAELTVFAQLWQARRDLDPARGAALLNEALQGRAVDALILEPPAAPASQTGSEMPVAADLTGLLRAGASLLDAARRAYDPEQALLPATSARVAATIAAAAEQAEVASEHVLALATLRGREDYSAVHACNRTWLTLALAARLGINGPPLEILGRAALLCDVGMASAAPRARGVPGPLDPNSTQAVLEHPFHSFAVAVQCQHLGEAEMVQAVVAAEHHCGVDGQGYPAAAPLGAPHLHARLVAVCDGYDALVHDRGDRAGLARPLALEALYDEAGSRYDEVVLDALASMLGRFPPGSVVRLREGHIAMVVRPSSDPRLFDRPEVLVLRDPGGRPLPRPQRLHLGKQRGDRATRVVEVLDDRLFPERLVPLVFGPA